MRGNVTNGHDRLAGLAIRCQSDSRLVRLAREGHEPAFEEIVRRYRVPLVTYASGIVPDHHAEDVVQDALTKAHAALGRSDPEMNVKPWLYTIVRNAALNALRDEPVHDHLDENFDGVPQPPDVAARRQELAALTAGLKDLPAPQRAAIVKRELEGRSHEEIAASLGVSPGAARGLIFRARTALRDGAGMLIPLPVLRVLLGSGSSASEATGAVGGAAAAAAGGGGIAVKAGATLGVAVIAVGSGIAIQGHHGSTQGPETAGAQERGHASRSHSGADSNAARIRETLRAGGNHGPGPDDSSGPGSKQSSGSGSRDSSGPSGHSGSPGSSSAAGPGGQSGSGSSGEGSGSDDPAEDGGHGGDSGSGGDDGGGSGDLGDDGGGSSGDSGSGGGDEGDSGTSGHGGGSGETDDGGSSGSDDEPTGSGSSGDDGETTTTTPTPEEEDDGGTSGGSD